MCEEEHLVGTTVCTLDCPEGQRVLKQHGMTVEELEEERIGDRYVLLFQLFQNIH